MAAREFYLDSMSRMAALLSQELSLTIGEHYRVLGAVNAPRVVAVTTQFNPTVARKIMGMSLELSLAMGLGKDQSVRVGRGRAGALTIEVPKPRDLWFDVRLDHLPRRHLHRVTLGINVERRPVCVGFSDPLTPHWLIAGMTGSGKTNAQRLMVGSLALQCGPGEARFLLIDTRKRGRAWQDFKSLPHLLHPVVTDHEGALGALRWAAGEVNRRAESGQVLPRIFVCIDEVQDVSAEPAARQLLADVAATGREFGVHLIVATQNPTRESLGSTQLRRNMARLVGRVDGSTSALVATDVPGSGAELLTAAGDMLRIDPSGVERVAVARVGPEDLSGLAHTDQVPSLELPSEADPVARPGVDPVQLAAAVVLNCGITKLAGHLEIGSGRAREVLDVSRPLRLHLEGLGCVIPVLSGLPPGYPAGPGEA